MFIDVIVTLNIPMVLTYGVALNLCEQIELGGEVIVPLGSKKVYNAIVIDIHNREPEKGAAREIVSVSQKRVISQKQMGLWRWISKYYMIPITSIAHRFLPPSLKRGAVKDEAVAQSELLPVPKRTRKVAYLSLCDNFVTFEAIETLSEQLKRSKAKLKLLSIFVDEAEQLSAALSQVKIARKKLKELGCADTIVAQMVKSEILNLSVVEEEVLREFADGCDYCSEDGQLEKELLERVNRSFEIFNTSLLHINSRERCENLYISLIKEVMSSGDGQVLFITSQPHYSAQLFERFSSVFGDSFICDSKNRSSLQRHEDYMRILSSSSPLFVAGGRNSLFLPFTNLKAVIVDGENDTLLGSGEGDLQFNGRDCAVYLSYIHGAKCLLTSSFPSFESYRNCELKKYALVEELEDKEPKISIIERESIAPKSSSPIEEGVQKRFFSKLLLSQIEERIKKGEMTLLYQNRKGFSTVIVCKDCGEVVMCKNCNVPLVYSKSNGVARCRYCQDSGLLTEECPNCKSIRVSPQGIGTENVEEKIAAHFPLARIVRVDGDVVQKRGEFKKIENRIKEGSVDIVVATTLAAKLQFPSTLTLLGVINGDNIFSFPHFRTTENGFALLNSLYNLLNNSSSSQMIVQISKENSLACSIKQNSYGAIYAKEIKERMMFSYPPFSKIILFTLKDRDMEKLSDASGEFAAILRQDFGPEVIGPFSPQVDKIRREYIEQIMIKVRVVARLQKTKDLALQRIAEMKKKIKIEVSTY